LNNNIKINNVKDLAKRQPIKKRCIDSGNEISKFFGAINPYKKDNIHHMFFFETLGIPIVKNHLPIQFVESM
jgi:hypothetical protein